VPIIRIRVWANRICRRGKRYGCPDPQAQFYTIQPGESAIGIAEKFYKSQVKEGSDLRFYVGVLAAVNPKSFTLPSGGMDSVTAWKSVAAKAGFSIWVPSVAYAQRLRGQVNNGRLQDHPAEAAAELGKDIVRKTIKNLGGEEVLKHLNKIGANVKLVWENPGQFMSNLQKAFSQGFANFQAKFVEHLKGGVMDWLQSAMGVSFEVPQTLDAAGYTSVGLQVLGVDYTRNLRPLLVQNIGATRVTQLENGGSVLTQVIKTKSLTPVLTYVQSQAQALTGFAAELPGQIFTSLKDFALQAIVTAGITKLLAMIVPGGGVVQAAINIYNAVMFIIERAKQIGSFVNSLTSSFAAIAQGDLSKAIPQVESVLKSGLSLALGFLASAAGLTGIAGKIKTALSKLTAPIERVLQKIAGFFKQKFSSLVANLKPGSKPGGKPGAEPTTPGGKPTKPGEQQSGAPTATTPIPDGRITAPIEVKGDVEVHHVWAEIYSGQPRMMMESTPKELIGRLQDYKADARKKLSARRLSQADFDVVSGHCGFR
jgi:hypothetical protein